MTEEIQPMTTNIHQISKKLLERDLTIRYLIKKMSQIRNQLEHCRDIVDNKPALFSIIQELDRLDKQMAEEYRSIHNTSLSTLSHRIALDEATDGTKDDQI